MMSTSKQSTKPLLHRSCALMLACLTALSPAVAAAGPTIPGFYGNLPAPAVNTLPVPRANPTGATIDQSGNLLTVTQNQGQANVTIDWSSFNIGSAATVRFNQGTGTPGTSSWKPNSSYSALNRIYDKNPSQIYGKLQADGKVYLINQNGILFGPGSQVIANSMIASTLNMHYGDFMSGTLKFTAEDYQNPGYIPLTKALYEADTYHTSYNAAVASNLLLSPPNSQVAVSNHGTITANSGGSVFLLGPTVENYGLISAPAGNIGLVSVQPGAANGFDYDVLLKDSLDTSTYTIQQNVTYSNRAGGDAVNGATGQITADSGLVGMYGRTVTQNGLIRAITAVKKSGVVELLATDKIVTGPGSQTITPVSDSSDTIISSTATTGRINLMGLTTQKIPGINDSRTDYAPVGLIYHQGLIQAPSGTVVLGASDRIFLDTGSRIDVSGVWVDEPASAAIISPQMNTQNLRDNYGQKYGLLLGQYVTVDSLTGTGIGDISGYYGSTELTARERSTAGGSVYIGSQKGPGATNDATTKELIVKQGAEIDFAGGGYRYAAGATDTTKLVAGSKVYDISTAPEWLQYDKILNSQTFTSVKFGVSRTYTGLYTGGGAPVKTYSAGYVQGSDAGSLDLESRQVVLNGVLNGSATRGVYQTLTAELTDKMGDQNTQGRVEPAGGELTIGSGSKTANLNVNDPTATSGYTDISYYPDYVTNEIEIAATTTPLSASFGVNDPLPAQAGGKSVLSAETLNAAGLSTFSLYANQRITLDKGAAISLPSFSRTLPTTTQQTTVTMTAGTLDIRGSIRAPDGVVNLTVADNITTLPTIDQAPTSASIPSPTDHLAANSRYSALAQQRAFVDAGAVIDVSGDRIDNSSAGLAAGNQITSGHTAGGTISISDNSAFGDGVYIKSGATLDVSGGYSISSSGTVTGGDAGKIALAGSNVVAAGDLRGYSLTGNKGGSITLTAATVQVADSNLSIGSSLNADSPLPDSLKQGLVISGDRFAQTGFTAISLNSYGDLNVASGVDLTPSLAKLAQPVPGSVGAPTLQSSPTVSVTPDLAGSSSISLQSGTTTPSRTFPVVGAQPAAAVDFSSKLNVSAGARIEAAPGGSISLTGYDLQIDGELTALAGSISATAQVGSTPNDGTGTLVVGPHARLNAQGYNKPLYGTVAGIPQGFTPLDGGTITVSAAYSADTSRNDGDITISNGAVLDVSGSAPATNVSKLSDGTIHTTSVAGNAGSISITYQDTLTLNGELRAATHLTGLKGGGLTIAKNRDNTNGGTPLSVSSQDVQSFRNDGFDAFTFKSFGTLQLTGSVPISAGRSITLDAPVISGKGGDDIALEAPWLTLTNSYYPSGKTPTVGNGTMTLSGDFIDVTGDVVFTGFKTLNLNAGQDVRLSDIRYYKPNAADSTSSGLLETAGDLVIKAGRIYPTSQSVFKVKVDNGELTVLPGDTTPQGPVYSAYGSLTLTADNGIDQKGYIAAPMGSIDLEGGNGRVLLEAGSTTTTAGSASVYLGSLDDNLDWTTTSNQNTQPVSVSQEPSKSITINGKEIVTQAGSVVDASGGGSIFTYSFVPDLAGTVSPIDISGMRTLTDSSGNITGHVKTRSDRYVILADNSVQIPGFTYSYTDTNGKQKTVSVSAVYLQGVTLSDGTVLKAGTYSLLPEQFAFLPGALIVSPVNINMAATDHQTSQEGYAITAGYSTVIGTSLQPSFYTGYTVRSAKDVLKEGHFETKQIVAGSGGTVKISGTTAILEGSLNANGLSGYGGGIVDLSGKGISVTAGDEQYADTLDFSTPVPVFLQGSLQVSAATLAAGGMSELDLGHVGTGKTDTITIGAGSNLSVPKIALAANSSITIESGAQLNAVASDGTGTVSLITGGTTTTGGRTAGKISIQQNAVVHASDTVNLTADTIDLQGSLTADHSTLNLSSNASDSIYVVPDNYTPVGSTPALYLTDSLLSKFSTFDNISLTSKASLTFKEDTVLGVANQLTVDVAGISADAGATIALNARSISLLNSGNSRNAASASGTVPTTIDLNADAIEINVGSAGDSSKPTTIGFNGFTTVGIHSAGDLTLKGVGTLATGGNLDITAARVTTGAYYPVDSTTKQESASGYTASRITLTAGGDATIGGSGGVAGSTETPGGYLAVQANNIDIKPSGFIDMPSGQANLTAAGDLTLESGARILATGVATRTEAPEQTTNSRTPDAYVYAPGGQVTLSAGENLALEQGSLIDVSAAAKGDAGTISISAPNSQKPDGTAGAVTSGTLRGVKGSNADALGGSFVLDTSQLSDSDLADLIARLTDGGFDQSLGIRARKGDLNVTSTITAHEITLEADGQDSNPSWDVNQNRVAGNATGNITITGTLDASGQGGGGQISLSARNDLTLASTSRLLAKGSGANAGGGSITLEAGDVTSDGHSYGWLNVNAGATIDVSGTGSGTGGTLYLRSMRNDANSDVQVNFDSAASVKGAAEIDLEAVKVYNTDAAGTLPDTSRGGALYNDTADFMGYTLATGTYTTQDIVNPYTNQATTEIVSATTTFTDLKDGNFYKSVNGAPIGNDRLSGLTGNSGFRLLPGIEIRNSSSLALTSDWDLSAWRATVTPVANPVSGNTYTVTGLGLSPGVITLRSGGDLNINANLVDYTRQDPLAFYDENSFKHIDYWLYPAYTYQSVSSGGLTKSQALNSWGINLVAGADLQAGNPLALDPDKGNGLTIGSGYMVYTEKAPVNFSSAGDTTLYSSPPFYEVYNIVYNLSNNIGTLYGDVTGKVGGNLILNGGVIQTATGNINLTVKGAIQFNETSNPSAGSTSSGAIRTMGQQPDTIQFEGDTTLSEYWNYTGGGNISVTAGNGISGAYATNASWDMANYRLADTVQLWSADYLTGTQGIAAMGGGDVRIWSGNDFASQAGTFGAGNLEAYVAGNGYGRFLVNNGTGNLTVMGSLGAMPVFGSGSFSPTYRQPVIEMMNESVVKATAYGSITLGSILDPTLTDVNFGKWNPTYGSKGLSDISLTSLGGGVSLLGSVFDRDANQLSSSPLSALMILPSSLEVAAAGDITFYQNTYLSPSPSGDLQLYSGGSISGGYKTTQATTTTPWVSLQMSDLAMTGSGGFYTSSDTLPDMSITSTLPTAHGLENNNPLHFEDTDGSGSSIPVTIKAKGDISNLSMSFPKETDIAAGRDLSSLYVSAQNLRPDDITSITAGRDIVLTQSPNASGASGIVQGGPGYLFVMAGDSIDLGNSQGVQTVGNQKNPNLSSDGSTLFMISGSDEQVAPGEVETFFDELRSAGNDYSSLLAEGKTAAAQAEIQQTRNSVIEPFLAGFSGNGGSISMVQSQVSSLGDNGDIYMVATKDIDVGRSALAGSSSGTTGIYTAKGGSINIYSGEDFNVNSSKTMTFFGGDITVWSDSGNINAGRGSKTAISAQPPHRTPIYASDGTTIIGYKIEFTPPSVGSGIRALTYDPNTYPGEGLATPSPGDVYLFAPQGVIDAGEAGIAGGKVTLGATEVLNSQNIAFSAGSVGVPSAGAGAVSIGALSGTSGLADSSKMIEQTTGAGAAREALKSATQVLDDFMAKFLDVKVISFDEDDTSGKDKDKDKR